MATKEYFPGIGKIKFEGKESMNPMAYRYYDAEKVIMGKKMKDWLKFAMAWWHTLCAEGGDQFGGGTKQFPWNGDSDALQAAKNKLDAGFEFMQKMEDWLKFAMAWWHTLCAEGGDQFGGGTKQFPWNGDSEDRKSTRLNSSHDRQSRMPSSA